jgi:hypothetical protein
MTSSTHEALVELFRTRPALAVELLAAGLGMAPAEHEQVRLEPTDLPDLVPVEFRADAVVALHRGGVAVQALVVEVQLRRDADKRRSRPCYVANLRARLGCPVDVLVLAPRRRIAAWCCERIPLGVSGSVVVPLVIGPDEIPVVTDPAEAVRDPEALMTTTPIDPLRSEIGRIVFGRAIEEGRERGLAEGHEQGLAEGETAGKAAAVLAARRIAVPDDARARIGACRDAELVDAWVSRAVTVTSIDELPA